MDQQPQPKKAFLLAPPIAVAIFLIIDVGRYAFDGWKDYGAEVVLDAIVKILIALPAASLIAYFFALVFGLPLYFLLKRLGIVSPWVTISFAAMIGALFMLLPELLLGQMRENSSFGSYRLGCQEIVDGVRTTCGYRLLAHDTIKAAGVGAIAGLAFWFIYAGGWKRPARNS